MQNEQLQGRYRWIEYEGRRRLTRVARGTEAHLKATLKSGQISLCSPDTAEADYRMYGGPMPPDGSWLADLGIKFTPLGSTIVLAARDFSKALEKYLISS